MTYPRPLVLRWHRSIGRCVWTGLLGALGLVVAVFGWVGLIVGDDWTGLVVLGAGVVVTVGAELLSRRFWAVTVTGLRWPVPFGTKRLGWDQVRVTTRNPAPVERRKSDRIVVHRPDGTPLTWPRPETHGRCVDDLQWWHGLQAGAPHRDWRAVPDLRAWSPQPTRTVANRGGCRFQAVLGIILMLIAVASLVMGIGAAGLPAVVAWLLLALFFGGLGLRALRRAFWSIEVHPQGIVVQRFPARRDVPSDQIVGCTVQKEPKLVSIGLLTALASLGDLDADLPDHRYVPTLLLADGTALALRALMTRSRVRAEALALRTVDPAGR